MDLYETNDGKNVVNKDLTLIRQDVEFNLKTDYTDFDNPVFIIHAETSPTCDYVVCKNGSMKNRRYFIKKKVLLEHGMIELHCHVDGLESFWGQISGIRCIIDRQEHLYNDLFVDDQLPTIVSKQVETYGLGSVGGKWEYYVTVSGGVN